MGAILLWVEALNVGVPRPRRCTRIRLPMVFAFFRVLIVWGFLCFVVFVFFAQGLDLSI